MVKNEKLGRYDVSALHKMLNGIARLPDEFLVIKGYLGSIPPSIIERLNIVPAIEEQFSSALMRLADLILFTHSSIVLQALQLKKPIFYFKLAVLVTPNAERLEME